MSKRWLGMRRVLLGVALGRYQACLSHAIHDLARQGLYDAALAR